MKPVRLLLLALLGIVISISLPLFLIAKEFLDAESVLEAKEEAARSRIAASINVAPTWDNIERYIYCEITPKGRTRLDVEKDLNQIGKYRFFNDYGSGADEYGGYIFSDVGIYSVVYGVYVKYTEADIVGDAMIRETQGSMESYIYKRFDCASGEPIF